MNRSGQWAKAARRQRRSQARENCVLFTSYLMEHGYTDTSQLATFWGMSSSTIRKYKKEAKHVSLAQEDRDNIQEIKQHHDCTLPQAVKKYYHGETPPSQQSSAWIGWVIWGIGLLYFTSTGIVGFFLYLIPSVITYLLWPSDNSSYAAWSPCRSLSHNMRKNYSTRNIYLLPWRCDLLL